MDGKLDVPVAITIETDGVPKTHGLHCRQSEC